MKYKIFAIILLIGFIFTLSFSKSKDIEGKLKIIKVYDGDTILAQIKDRKYNSENTFRIRLIGIDCFEGAVSERANYQAKKFKMPVEKIVEGGNIAGDILKNELKNKTITFDFKGIDKYGRALGVIYANGEDINEKMLKTEYCMVY